MNVTSTAASSTVKPPDLVLRDQLAKAGVAPGAVFRVQKYFISNNIEVFAGTRMKVLSVTDDNISFRWFNRHLGSGQHAAWPTSWLGFIDEGKIALVT